jgi:hypothetical protein
MATLFTSGYITLLHRTGQRGLGEEIAGPSYSTQGVCGPSFNGVANDHQIGFHSSREINLSFVATDRAPEKEPPRRTGPNPKALPVHPWSRPPGYPRRRSDGAQIVCRGFAGPAIGYYVERNLLSLIEAVHPSTFNGADVHEDILAAVIRLDKAEAFLAVEPLYCTLRHMTFFQVRVQVGCAVAQPCQCSRFGGGRQSDADCAAGPSRSAETRFTTNRALAGDPQGRQGQDTKKTGYLRLQPLFYSYHRYCPGRRWLRDRIVLPPRIGRPP